MQLCINSCTSFINCNALCIMSMKFSRTLSAEQGQRIAICCMDKSQFCVQNILLNVSKYAVSKFSWYNAHILLYCNSTNIKSNPH